MFVFKFPVLAGDIFVLDNMTEESFSYRDIPFRVTGQMVTLFDISKGKKILDKS
jgi:hypothetical protein